MSGESPWSHLFESVRLLIKAYDVISEAYKANLARQDAAAQAAQTAQSQPVANQPAAAAHDPVNNASVAAVSKLAKRSARKRVTFADPPIESPPPVANESLAAARRTENKVPTQRTPSAGVRKPKRRSAMPPVTAAAAAVELQPRAAAQPQPQPASNEPAAAAQEPEENASVKLSGIKKLARRSTRGVVIDIDAAEWQRLAANEPITTAQLTERNVPAPLPPSAVIKKPKRRTAKRVTNVAATASPPRVNGPALAPTSPRDEEIRLKRLANLEKAREAKKRKRLAKLKALEDAADPFAFDEHSADKMRDRASADQSRKGDDVQIASASQPKSIPVAKKRRKKKKKSVLVAVDSAPEGRPPAESPPAAPAAHTAHSDEIAVNAAPPLTDDVAVDSNATTLRIQKENVADTPAAPRDAMQPEPVVDPAPVEAVPMEVDNVEAERTAVVKPDVPYAVKPKKKKKKKSKKNKTVDESMKQVKPRTVAPSTPTRKSKSVEILNPVSPNAVDPTMENTSTAPCVQENGNEEESVATGRELTPRETAAIRAAFAAVPARNDDTQVERMSAFALDFPPTKKKKKTGRKAKKLNSEAERRAVVNKSASAAPAAHTGKSNSVDGMKPVPPSSADVAAENSSTTLRLEKLAEAEKAAVHQEVMQPEPAAIPTPVGTSPTERDDDESQRAAVVRADALPTADNATQNPSASGHPVLENKPHVPPAAKRKRKKKLRAIMNGKEPMAKPRAVTRPEPAAEPTRLEALPTERDDVDSQRAAVSSPSVAPSEERVPMEMDDVESVSMSVANPDGSLTTDAVAVALALDGMQHEPAVDPTADESDPAEEDDVESVRGTLTNAVVPPTDETVVTEKDNDDCDRRAMDGPKVPPLNDTIESFTTVDPNQENEPTVPLTKKRKKKKKVRESMEPTAREVMQPERSVEDDVESERMTVDSHNGASSEGDPITSFDTTEEPVLLNKSSQNCGKTKSISNRRKASKKKRRSAAESVHAQRNVDSNGNVWPVGVHTLASAVRGMYDYCNQLDEELQAVLAEKKVAVPVLDSLVGAFVCEAISYAKRGPERVVGFVHALARVGGKDRLLEPFRILEQEAKELGKNDDLEPFLEKLDKLVEEYGSQKTLDAAHVALRKSNSDSEEIDVDSSATEAPSSTLGNSEGGRKRKKKKKRKLETDEGEVRASKRKRCRGTKRQRNSQVESVTVGSAVAARN